MSARNGTKLKGLESQLKQAQGEYSNLQLEAQGKQQECTHKKDKITELKKAINKFKVTGKPIVSEHAILRYLERVGGMNMEQIKNFILNEEALSYISSMGDGTYPIENRFNIVVKNNTIITILI